VHCLVQSLSLLYLNPPYDFECGEVKNRRMEEVFLEQFYRWLKPGGVLVLVIPGQRQCACDQYSPRTSKTKGCTGSPRRNP